MASSVTLTGVSSESVTDSTRAIAKLLHAEGLGIATEIASSLDFSGEVRNYAELFGAEAICAVDATRSTDILLHPNGRQATTDVGVLTSSLIGGATTDVPLTGLQAASSVNDSGCYWSVESDTSGCLVSTAVSEMSVEGGTASSIPPERLPMADTSVLKNMILQVRTKVKDLSVRVFHEQEIINALNEGKDEIVKIIRQAEENYFETTAQGIIYAATPPNYSSVTLPTDFSELRNIQITTSGYEDIGFMRMSQSDTRFKTALLDGGSFSNGEGMFFWDFVGLDTIILAPATDINLSYLIHYIKQIPDMSLPNHYPIGIPTDSYGFIITWAICECMRTVSDERLAAYLEKLEFQKESVIQSVNTRQDKEASYVTGFMENEYWG